MNRQDFIQQGFFFALFVLAGYLVWLLIAPFVVALTLATVLVVVSYPLHTAIQNRLGGRYETFTAITSTFIVVFLLLVPITLLSALLVQQFLHAYQAFQATDSSALQFVTVIEQRVQTLIPGLELNVTDRITDGLGWLSGNLGNIFAGTASAAVGTFLTLFGTFYLFRDGPRLVQWITRISPLPDNEDELILTRVGRSVRSVVGGTVFIAFIQGLMASLGFALFGVPQPFLWGMVAALAALIPAVGTSVVLIPAVVFLFVTSSPLMALGLLVWGIAMVGSIDNVLAPYVLSRGNNIHPFVILIAVLGGLSVFGPIGFILGPVFVSLFLVLVELYSTYFTTTARSEGEPS